MLALIAGMGDLPPALIARLPSRPFVCALQGFEPEISVDLVFRLEHLGTFLQELQTRGVTQICMAGAVRRPEIDPGAIDAATMPLIPQVQAAMAQGDDGALRVIIALLEQTGFAVVAAHEIAPDLLPDAGVLTTAEFQPSHRTDAALGEACVAEMGAGDVGQACLIREAQVVATESQTGTDVMLDAPAVGAVLYKAPKPDQDRRADLPVIGAGTAERAVTAGLVGIVIEAGGVMVLDAPRVVEILNKNGLFLWVRPKGDA